DLDHLIYAGTTTCHESVEPSPADHHEVGAKGMSRNNIGAIGHAGVQDDGGVFAKFSGDIWQQMEGNWRAVELATTVVGQHDSVNTSFDHPSSIGEGLNSFDHNLAGPEFADNVEICFR